MGQMLAFHGLLLLRPFRSGTPPITAATSSQLFLPLNVSVVSCQSCKLRSASILCSERVNSYEFLSSDVPLLHSMRFREPLEIPDSEDRHPACSDWSLQKLGHSFESTQPTSILQRTSILTPKKAMLGPSDGSTNAVRRCA